MNARGFKTLVECKFWDRLSEANQFHVKAQQQYLHLLKDLENQGVAFNDIRAYMLNRAKVAGLLQKTVMKKDGTKTYPSNKKLKDLNYAWFVALQNFTRWVNDNYDGSYTRQITSEMKKAKRLERQANKSQKKTTAITRTADGEEARTEVVESTTDMDAPVETSLTSEQLQAIVLNNLGILGDYAAEKGERARIAFNTLMTEIGQPEQAIMKEDVV